MFDQLIGLLLLGLGIRTNPAVNPNVKGDETVATASVSRTARSLKDDVRAFRNVRQASSTAIRENRKNEVASREAQLKEKLQEMKDKKKSALIQRISENCQKINEKRTERMNQMLEKLSAILENVVNRSSSSSASGKDTSSVDTAVAAAHTAIADAQSAVDAQAGTQCVMTINSETTAKNDVGTAISGLEKDLKAVFDKVTSARKAVGSAIKALGLALGESL